MNSTKDTHHVNLSVLPIIESHFRKILAAFIMTLNPTEEGESHCLSTF